MKVGYSFWGSMADYRIKDGQYVSAPDGNATYSWTIIRELQKRGHDVYRLMPDRDYECVSKRGVEAFASFAQRDRFEAYRDMISAYQQRPQLDLILHEWRMPIAGRNTPESRGLPHFEPDIDVQNEILNWYTGRCPLVAFDLDYQMTPDDDKKFTRVLDLGFKEGPNREHVEIPFDFTHIADFPIFKAEKKIVYIGNRYNRDWAIEKYLDPISHNICVELHGNWLEAGRDSQEQWPQMTFGPRAHVGQFRSLYQTSAVTPLLLKEEYCQNSFMTARVWETLLFGSLPIGIKEFRDLNRYLPDSLVVEDARGLLKIATRSAGSIKWRRQMIEELRARLEFMDARHFVNNLLK